MYEGEKLCYLAVKSLLKGMLSWYGKVVHCGTLSYLEVINSSNMQLMFPSMIPSSRMFITPLVSFSSSISISTSLKTCLRKPQYWFCILVYTCMKHSEVLTSISHIVPLERGSEPSLSSMVLFSALREPVVRIRCVGSDAVSKNLESHLVKEYTSNTLQDNIIRSSDG